MTAASTQPWFIVEHPLRGVLMNQEHDLPTGWRTTWAWSKPRSEAKRFTSLKTVGIALHRLPEDTRETATILQRVSTEEGTWKEVPR